MSIYDQIIELFWEDEVSTMALFTAYIDCQLGYETFCRELPMEWFDMLKSKLKESADFQEALRESVLISRGVATFLEKSVTSYDMWCRLLEGTKMILTDPLMRESLFDDDVYFIEGMYSRWCEGMLSEGNWDASVEKWGKNSILSGIAF